MPSNVFQWDELNIIRKDAEIMFGGLERPKKEDIEKFCDYLEYVLCLVYAYGWHDAEEIVGIVPFKDGDDTETVNLEIDGKTFRERITEDSSYEEVLRIIDTESHRDYNTAVFDAAEKSGVNVRKMWNTMLDDKVRETHRYLEGIEIGMNDLFYSESGASALYPGGFGDPMEDIGCRCFLTLRTVLDSE